MAPLGDLLQLQMLFMPKMKDSYQRIRNVQKDVNTSSVVKVVKMSTTDDVLSANR